MILAFDGSKINELHDLPRLVAAVAPDSAATVTVWRDGREIELQAKLGELPDNNQVASANSGPEEEQSAQATALGMHFAPLTNELRQRAACRQGC